MPVDCDQMIVQGVGGKLTGGAGPNSVDGEVFKRYLLNHGEHSCALREEMALWVELLANNIVPYAAHRALETGRLTALDKQPGVRPIGVASVASRTVAKCLLKVVGDDAKAACGNVNLCAGLEAGIEGALHAVRARAAMNGNMEFGDWEINQDMFADEAAEGEVQDSLPMRRAKEARAAMAAAADPPPT